MKKNILILLICLFCTIAACAYDGPDWRRVDDNNFIDVDSIVGLDEIYGYSFLLKSFNKGQYEPVNGKNISYVLGHYEINCLKKTYKIGIMDSYDSLGNFVNGDYNRYSEFRPVVYGTAVGIVAKKLCIYNSEH
ncbi:hypothetical protein IJ579_07105 [bacterium]|nr:hypothetical protein [bacterium]